MVKLTNLTKIYKTANGQQKALNNVSFELASNGIVFVVGKSGSGKTTMMNLIGGLDFASNGQIIVDGNEITKFNEEEYENYRNSHVGFIFQDFFLLENLTVKENIEVSLKLQNKEVEENEINKILNLVDLDGLASRYPNELSGGQKQRVAIARALIKKPKILLADEPTGNLDSKTAGQILDVLKELSKDVLVLIVSHNMQEAQKYADRIIKLENGNVIDDIQRTKNFEKSLIVDNVINFPYNIKLSKDELAKINSAIQTGNYELSQDMNIFEPTENVIDDNKNIEIIDYKMKTSKLMRVKKIIQKGSGKSSILTSLTVSLLLILLMVSMVFANYQYAPLIKQVMEDNNDVSYVLRKGYYNDSLFATIQENAAVRISEDEIQSFYEEGYEGNIYNFYNKTIHTIVKDAPTRFPDCGIYEKPRIVPYGTYGNGVLDCDIEYINKLFGNGKDINILAGSLDKDFKPYGYLIPDYMADSIIFNNPYLKAYSTSDAYKEIVNLKHINNSYTVKAIFETNYKQKYKNLFETLINYSSNPSEENTNKYTEMVKSEEYAKFIDECEIYLGIAYYIGDLPIADAILTDTEVNQKCVQLYNTNYEREGMEGIYEYNSHAVNTYSDFSDLKDGEILVSSHLYNTLFNKNIAINRLDDFEEKTITITSYPSIDKYKENPIYKETFKITGVFDHRIYKSEFAMTYNDYSKLLKTNIYTSALYFDNVDSITKIYSPNKETTKNYYASNNYYKAIYKVTDTFVMFESLFIVFSIILAISSIALMASHIKRNIKNKTYEIGVLKGIGLKNTYVFKMYFLQLISLILLILIITTLSLFLFDKLINMILINNLDVLLPNSLKNSLIFFEFDTSIILIIYGLVIVLSLLTTYILITSLKKIKPIDIIKADDD